MSINLNTLGAIPTKPMGEWPTPQATGLATVRCMAKWPLTSGPIGKWPMTTGQLTTGPTTIQAKTI